MQSSIDFTNASIPYEVFIKDLASEIIKQMREAKDDKENISQRQAYEKFGRANVTRWKKDGLVTPVKRGGKIEYSTAQLRLALNKGL